MAFVLIGLTNLINVAASTCTFIQLSKMYIMQEVIDLYLHEFMRWAADWLTA